MAFRSRRVPGNQLSSAARRRLIERSRGHNGNRRQDDGREAADTKCGRYDRSESRSSRNSCGRILGAEPIAGIGRNKRRRLCDQVSKVRTILRSEFEKSGRDRKSVEKGKR